MIAHPPRLAERLVTWSLAEDERAAVLGDLEEEFHDRVADEGADAAQRWYWKQTMKSLVPNCCRRERLTFRIAAAPVAVGMLGSTLDILFHGASAGELARTLIVLTAIVLAWLAAAIVVMPFLRAAEMRPAQGRVLKWLGAVWFVALGIRVILPTQATVAIYGNVVVPTFGTIGVGVLLWRKWPVEQPAEIYLRPKSTDDPMFTLASLAFALKNVPFSVSGLVLSQRREQAADGAPVLHYAPTIRRVFASDAVLQVSLAIKTPHPASLRVTLDVINAAGSIVKTLPAHTAIDALERVANQWSPKSIAVPDAHFCQAQAAVELSALPPGTYTLRVIADDGERRSIQQERIERATS